MKKNKKSKLFREKDQIIHEYEVAKTTEEQDRKQLERYKIVKEALEHAKLNCKTDRESASIERLLVGVEKAKESVVERKQRLRALESANRSFKASLQEKTFKERKEGYKSTIKSTKRELKNIKKCAKIEIKMLKTEKLSTGHKLGKHIMEEANLIKRFGRPTRSKQQLRQ